MDGLCVWKGVRESCRNKREKEQEGRSETLDQMVWLCVGRTRKGGKGTGTIKGKSAKTEQ